MLSLSLYGPAGVPFTVLNTLVGILTAYGLTGLRPDAWAVAQCSLVLVLQSLVAIQIVVLSAFVSPNQVRPHPELGKHVAFHDISSESQACSGHGRETWFECSVWL